MSPDEGVACRTRLPLSDVGCRVVVKRPEIVPPHEPVHFFAVDLRGVVIGRRPETVPFLRAGGVHVRATVGDEMRALESRLEGQAVVVPVAAPSTLADWTAVDEDVIAIVPHDVEA